MDYVSETFPAQVLSGTGVSGGVYLYSWKEVVIDGRRGLYSGQVSPRFGVNNARELNNSPLSGYWPFYAAMMYEGQVSGKPFYSFNAGVTRSGAAATPWPGLPIYLDRTLSGTAPVLLDTIASGFFYGPNYSGTFNVETDIAGVLQFKRKGTSGNIPLLSGGNTAQMVFAGYASGQDGVTRANAQQITTGQKGFWDGIFLWANRFGYSILSTFGTNVNAMNISVSQNSSGTTGTISTLGVITGQTLNLDMLPSSGTANLRGTGLGGVSAAYAVDGNKGISGTFTVAGSSSGSTVTLRFAGGILVSGV